jgi:pilus assembly protein CpaC
VTITAGGTQYPTFTTRSVSTTVQLKNGEHLVIGGLMRNNVSQNVKAFPVLGQLPILGVLFRSTEFISDKTELVIIVSPSLVKGTTSAPQAPTDKFVPPSRTDLFIGGKLEGN